MEQKLLKMLWNIGGFVCLVVGFVGLFVPIFPTVPFLLLASFCFARGSKRFHQWLRQNEKFGAQIRAWEDHGIVSRRAKVISTVMIVCGIVFSCFLLGVDIVVLPFIAVPLGGVLWFIWTRPEAPTPQSIDRLKASENGVRKHPA